MPDGSTGALRQEGDTWTSTLGWTGEPDGMAASLGARGDNEIRFGPVENMRVYAREPLEIVDTTFEHDGLTFSARLIWVERAPLVHPPHSLAAERKPPD